MTVVALSLFSWLEFVIRHPGLVIVLIGVVGEVFFDWAEMTGRGGRGKRISAILLVLGLVIEFGEAAKSDKQLVMLQEDITQMRKDNALLVVAGEKAKESAAMATRAAENAKAEREKSEAGRLELEKQVLALAEKTKTRTINKDTENALVRDLVGLEKGKVDIVMFDKDPEAIAFGFSLKKALTEAGCTVILSPRSIFNLDIIPGIVESGYDLVFCVKNAKSPPLYAQKILISLGNNRIKATGWPYNHDLDSDALQIWVCPKASISSE